MMLLQLEYNFQLRDEIDTLEVVLEDVMVEKEQ